MSRHVLSRNTRLLVERCHIKTGNDTKDKHAKDDSWFDVATFVGDFKINRKDYGINGNIFSFAIGKEFDITLRVPVTKNK